MNNMKVSREKKILKQKDLAKAAGLSNAAISLYENKKSIPSLKSAFRISMVLGVSVDELFSWVVNENVKH